jgi:hypothetical protein
VRLLRDERQQEPADGRQELIWRDGRSHVRGHSAHTRRPLTAPPTSVATATGTIRDGPAPLSGGVWMTRRLPGIGSSIVPPPGK